MKATEESVESAAPTVEEPAAIAAALSGGFGGSFRSPLARQALAMQAAAGNQATGSWARGMVAREPTIEPPPSTPIPAKPVAPPPPRDEPLDAITPQLAADQRALMAKRDVLAKTVGEDQMARAVAEKAGTPLTPDSIAKQDADKAELKRVQGEIVQRQKDLDVLDPYRPYITPQERNDIIARYRVTGGVPGIDGKSKTGQALIDEENAMLDPKKPLSSGRTWSKDGVSTTSGSVETATQFNPDGSRKSTTTERTGTGRWGNAGGYDYTGTRKTTTVDGSKTTTDEGTSKHGVSIADPGYSYSYENKKSSADSATGASSSDRQKFEAAAGIGGANMAYTSQADGGPQQKVDVGVKRGNNALTLGGGYSGSTGKFDDDNNLTEGKKSAYSGSGGVYTDKDKGVGFGGDLSITPPGVVSKNPQLKDFDGTEQAPGRQREWSRTVTAGGRVWTNIKKDPESGKYLLVTTVNLSVGGSISASGGQEGSNKEKVSVGATAGLSASGEVVFRRLLSESETTQYLEDVKNGGTGSLPEHKLLQIGVTKGWDEARKVWTEMVMTDPTLAQSLKQGESLDVTNERGTNVGANASASAADMGVGVTYSKAHKHRVKVSEMRDKADKPNELRVRIEEIDEDSATVGASASATMVGGSVTHAEGKTGGASATFKLTDTAGDFATILAKLKRATTVGDLDSLKVEFKALLIGSSDISGTSSSTDVAVTAGPEWLKAKANIGGSAKTSTEVEKDAEGKRTGGTYSGSNTTGGGGGILGINYQQSVTETYEGKVKDLKDDAGEYQVATGKTTSAETKTNWGKSWDAAKKAWSGDKLKLATDGAAGVMQTDTTTSESMNAANADFDNIVAEANDEASWNSHVVGNERRPPWIKAGAQIRAASTWDDEKHRWKYDVHKIQAILSTVTANEAGGTKAGVDNVIRSTKTGQGGLRTEFPGELSAIEKDFTDIVITDPVATLSSLRVADKVLTDNIGKSDLKPVSDAYGKAVAELKALRERLDKLAAALQGKEGLFSAPGVHAEMLAAVVKRQGSIDGEISASQSHIAGPTTVAGGYTESLERPDGDDYYKNKFEAEKSQNVQDDAAIKERNKAEAPQKQQALDTMVRQMAALEGGIPPLVTKARSLGDDLRGNIEEINKNLNNAKGLFGQWQSLITECERLVEWYPGVNGAAVGDKKAARSRLAATYEAACNELGKRPWG